MEMRKTVKEEEKLNNIIPSNHLKHAITYLEIQANH